jgi:hypothetical protein
MTRFLAGRPLTRACSRGAEEARRSARPQCALSALWNVGLCGGGLDGSQLMRKSLGGCSRAFDVSQSH